MKFSIIDSRKRLERLVMHLESTLGMSGPGESPDKFITQADFEVLTIAALTKAPEFVEWLIRLLMLTKNSRLGPKVIDTLAAVGAPAIPDLISLLDTEHGPRAAKALAEIGTEAAARPVLEKAAVFTDYMPAALTACRKLANDRAIKFLVDTLAVHKPFGFPKNLLNKEENMGRIGTTNIVLKALKDITGGNFKDAGEWDKWWRERGKMTPQKD
jgi:hypothetical protein